VGTLVGHGLPPSEMQPSANNQGEISPSDQLYPESITLAEEQTSKFLGVDLKSDLGWTQHIDKIPKKLTTC